MLFSGVFSIRYSILVVIYNSIFARFFKRKIKKIDIAAIRFAQFLGVFLLAWSLFNFYLFKNNTAGWTLVLVVLVSTAFGASGYCVGAKLYQLIRGLFKK